MSTSSTRKRILDATVALHEDVGPAATTIRAIAERAGVQRLTVYRHFPDERSLIQGCSAHWSADHPPPDPSVWAGLRDPDERLRIALEALYAYFARGAPMLTQVFRDEAKVPALQEVLIPFRDHMSEMAGGLSVGWEVDRERQRLVRAAVGHALHFWTWRSLDGEGLSTREAVHLMTRFVAHVATFPDPPDRGD